ncbi:50S ribosomal protein L13 [Suttonella ornithocola]|uniref:Large ribosomal subunit protein uL13 n=1 Tax=Suttonella ornithocola TaxID=279832 RepID=A0A380MPB4_9GAMM|nr:50S ribosomal protein L13 [Suttonella ornithocola]SUO94445.1 50S ribosomal protein L13 [Suttonella ornithocola]
MLKTYTATPASVSRDWYVVDAEGKTLGRLATEIARRLRGKHKPEYTPNIDTGDYIIVINADKISVTGRKGNDKMYHHHTGYIGNLKSANFNQMQERRPGKVLELAVKGMLPRGPLGRTQLKKLKIYSGSEHEHAAQQPITLDV